MHILPKMLTFWKQLFQNSRKEKKFQMVQLCSAPPRRASQDILGCGGLGFGDPGGNSAEWFVFWTVLGIPNFQVTQEIFIDVQPNCGLWIFFSGDHWIGHLHFWSRFAVGFQLNSLLHRIDALHFPVFFETSVPQNIAILRRVLR